MKKIVSMLLVVILSCTIEYSPISADTIDYYAYDNISPYETKRIIVYAKHLENDYNAVISSYDYGAFTLEYKTESDTAKAYKYLVSDFGSDNVVLDKIFNLYSFNQEDYINQDFYQYLPNIRSGNYPLIKDINDYSGTKNEIIVGVIDTGFDTDTSFYSDRYIYELCTSFIADGDLPEGDPEDLDGHGSSVCFAIANSSPDNVKIISYKIFDSEGNSSIVAVRKALLKAYEDGVDIVNMSWGGDSTFSVLNRDLKTLYDANITMIAAAGNEGTETVDEVYPANSNYTIAVSSVSNEKIDDKYVLSDFSTYGSSITFSSPGEHLSLASNDEKIYYCTGTSYAAPILSGQLATLKTFVTTTSKEEDINLLKRYISSDFEEDYELDADYKSTQYGYGYLDFSNTRLCTCGESYCHMVYHDDMEEVTSETSTIQNNNETTSLIYENTETTTIEVNQETPMITLPNPVTTTISEESNTQTTVVTTDTTTTNIETTFSTQNNRKVNVKTPKKFKLKAKKRSIIISYKKRKRKDRVVINISKRKNFKTIKKIITKKKRVKYKVKKKGFYYIKIRTLRVVGKKKYYSKYSKVKRIKV